MDLKELTFLKGKATEEKGIRSFHPQVHALHGYDSQV